MLAGRGRTQTPSSVQLRSSGTGSTGNRHQPSPPWRIQKDEHRMAILGNNGRQHDSCISSSHRCCQLMENTQNQKMQAGMATDWVGGGPIRMSPFSSFLGFSILVLSGCLVVWEKKSDVSCQLCSVCNVFSTLQSQRSFVFCCFCQHCSHLTYI